MGSETAAGWTERAWQGVGWPVYRRALVTADNVDTMPPAPWLWPRAKSGRQEWLSVCREEEPGIRDDLRALGGLFVQQDEFPVLRYDLAEPGKAEGLVGTAYQVDPKDPQAVTQFINAWGQLGVEMVVRGHRLSNGTADLFQGCEALSVTREALETFQKHVQWLESLKARDAVALRKVVRRDSASAIMNREERWRQRWLAFSQSVEQHIGAVHPSIRWDREPEEAWPIWMVRCPKDALWATLWDWASRSGRLRRCRNRTCGVLFVTTDPRKECCSRECSKRRSASDWYWTRGGRELRKRRRGR